MSVPFYVTDADGWLTYYNEAAATLWGRRPEIGKDRWCGSLRIYQLDGTLLPHDQCGMAIALKEGRAVGEAQGIFERPDGTRVSVVGHPAPLRAPSGAIIAGSNYILDLSEMPGPHGSLPT